MFKKSKYIKNMWVCKRCGANFPKGYYKFLIQHFLLHLLKKI